MQLVPQSWELQSNTSLLFMSQLLLHQFRTTNMIEDLEEAISLAGKAEGGSDPLTPGLETMRLIHLARCLSQRHDETGDIGNLNDAVEYATKAFAEEKTLRHGSSWVAEKLVDILKQRWLRLGRREDLDEAVLKAQEADTLLPSTENRQKASRLATLAETFAFRAIATSSSEGFNQAIALMGEVLQQTTNEEFIEDYQFALGTFHFQKFSLGSGRVSDLDEAERTFQAIAERKLARQARVGDLLLERLFNTAFARERQSGWSGVKLVDVESMRFRYRPNEHSNNGLPSGVHYSIGLSFHRRYLAHNSFLALQAWEPHQSTVLDQAAFHLEKSIPAGLDNHPETFIARNTLGAVYMDKHFDRGRTATTSEDSDIALQHFRAVTESTEAEPFLRVHSARRAIILMTKTGMIAEAAQLADDTIDILPRLCSRSLNREDQHRNAEVPGLVSDACVLALRRRDSLPVQQRDIEEALRKAKLGRCMTLGYLIDGRRDISDMEEKHPDIAEKYDRLRFQAHRLVSPKDDAATQHRRIQQRQTSAKELEDLETQIRKLKNFENFLRPLTAKDCKKEAKHGPIVIINMTSFISDAIIVTESEIIHLPLEDMKSKAPISVFQNNDMYRGNNMGERDDIINLSQADIEINERVRNGELLPPDEEVSMTEWLWSTCVKLVVDKLSEIQALDPTKETRVWWIGMGLASSLPFGAAGIQVRGRIDKAQDCLTRVISSYIPTIKALNFARMYPRLSIAKDKGLSTSSMLMVTMPTTPWHSSLEGVQQEKQAVNEVMRNMEILQHPSAVDVLKALKRSPDCTFRVPWILRCKGPI